MSYNELDRLPRGRILLAVATIALVAACNQPMSTPIADQDLQSLDGPIVFGMTMFISVAGVREGRVEADTAYVFEDSTVIHLRRMEIFFYDQETGAERATVTGTTGRWDQETNEMVARGDVVLLVHTDGSTIESQEISYDPNNDRIWSDSATVRTLADGSVTSGTSFESDMSFENIFIANPRGGLRRQ
jgi:LPS export ABC transporter protein LptC